MNFIKAIQHATIGYGIRRKSWGVHPSKFLSLNNFGELEWPSTNVANRAELLGNDDGVDMTADDIKAIDWESVCSH